jgi:DNA-binding transcriptional LysR family regulator
MDLSQLRTFRAVAEAQSFTRAAARLNITQSAVSHQIKALEADLGEPLFVRSRRGARLSEAGRSVLERAGHILDEADALREAFSGRGVAPRGRVRVAAATQAFVHLFVPLFEAFMRTHPGIEVSFRTTSSTDQTVADLRSGATDIGFASLEVQALALRITPLFDDELSLVVGHAHRLAGRAEASVDELRQERLILFERGASIRRATDRFFASVSLAPDMALESNDTNFIKLMVERGLGISLLPAWAVREEASWGRLARLRIKGHRLRRKVALLSGGRFLPSATRVFLDFVRERRASLQEAARGDWR